MKIRLLRRIAATARRLWPRRNVVTADDMVLPQQPGLDCPRCGTRLTVTIAMLLSSRPLQCHGCSLVLHVDRKESRECLERLEELQAAIDRANALAAGREP